jgi:hypothetical protein
MADAHLSAFSLPFLCAWPFFNSLVKAGMVPMYSDTLSVIVAWMDPGPYSAQFDAIREL